MNMEIEFSWLKRISRKFWVPRFTTSEIEDSMTREGYDHTTDVIHYEDGIDHYPIEASGIVFQKDMKPVKVKWNEYGECTIKGKRAKNFDLVRDQDVRHEISATRNFFFGCIGILLIFIYMLIKL